MISKRQREYAIEADLPGVKKEEISLSMVDGKLVISVKKENIVDEGRGNYIHKERSYSSMSRAVYLENVKSKEIRAKLSSGILMVKVPKTPPQSSNEQITID